MTFGGAPEWSVEKTSASGGGRGRTCVCSTAPMKSTSICPATKCLFSLWAGSRVKVAFSLGPIDPWAEALRPIEANAAPGPIDPTLAPGPIEPKPGPIDPVLTAASTKSGENIEAVFLGVLGVLGVLGDAPARVPESSRAPSDGGLPGLDASTPAPEAMRVITARSLSAASRASLALASDSLRRGDGTQTTPRLAGGM